jgi:hypothetical protein
LSDPRAWCNKGAVCAVGKRIHFSNRCKCPAGTKSRLLNRSYRVCEKQSGKCVPGTQIHFTNRCTCPRGTKSRLLNRSYRICE